VLGYGQILERKGKRERRNKGKGRSKKGIFYLLVFDIECVG